MPEFFIFYFLLFTFYFLLFIVVNEAINRLNSVTLIISPQLHYGKGHIYGYWQN